MNNTSKILLILVLSLTSGFFIGKVFFPNIQVVEKKINVPVDRIVEKEKIVEKPVDVIRTVEKIVEVPAEPTDLQKNGAIVLGNILEADSRYLGLNATAVFPAKNKQVKVYVQGDSETFNFISKSEITARAESVFRRNGFTVLKEDGPHCDTVIGVKAYLISSNNNRTLSGSIRVEIEQEVMGFAGGLWKKVLVSTSTHAQVIAYGLDNHYKIPSLIESLAIQACNDLAAAGPTEKR